jgi:hypothetical protein
MTLPKRMVFFCACFILFVSCLNAQTISGTIMDALSKYPVSNAKITIVELNKEFITDSAGFFKTDTLAKGTYTVRIESMRYIKQNKTVRIIESKGETGTTDIKLDVLLFNIASDVDQIKGQMAVKYYFPNHADVCIEVCGTDGKAIRTVYDRSHLGGMRTFNWDGADNKGKVLPKGTYTCKFKSGNLFTSRILVWNGVAKQ